MATENTEPEVVELEPQTVAGLRETVPMEAIRDYYDRAYGQVAAVVAAQGVALAGPPVGVYFGAPTATADLAAGWPVDGVVEARDGVTAIDLPVGRAAQVVHAGGYDGLGQAYERLAAWIVAEGHTPGEVMWETYLTEPTPEADPADMRTLITWTLADG